MNYYSDYNNPAATQNDDLDIVAGALALAHTLRDDVSMSAANLALVAGIARTIRDTSHSLTHTIASKEVWRFGAYLPTAAIDDVDALIADHLETAQSLIEDAEL